MGIGPLKEVERRRGGIWLIEQAPGRGGKTARNLFRKALRKENAKRFDGLLGFNRNSIGLGVVDEQIKAVIDGTITTIHLIERLAAIKTFQGERTNTLPQ